MEQNSPFYLQDLFKVIWSWRKKIIAATLFITVITGIAVFLVPPQYLSEATITAANPNLGDRSNIFSTTFEEQFYYYGDERDNNRLYEIIRSDSMKRFLIDSFKLIDHYNIKKTKQTGKLIAFNKVKKNIETYITELGHINIKIWDTDKNLATNMVNAIIAKANRISVDKTNQIKSSILQKLESTQKTNEETVKKLSKQTSDSLPPEIGLAKKNSLLKQIEETDNLITQFKTSLNDVSNIYILKYPSPAFAIDRPDKLLVIVTAFLASLFFSLLVSLFVNRLQKRK
ncbi:MAG TPA: Wzz/FepE/Etk N-terminal domain-containing protein [Chitinophagaceae bacterium]|nr:Wzz/FepE/Etk N-terminal domain-containing protein [Chitinophagaceae bacterium]